MQEESVVLEPRDDYPLFITAQRYWLVGSERYSDHPDALTLIFLHSTSFHKETFSVTIQHILDLAQSAGPIIREAWALDCPNHGEAAQLNEAALMIRNDTTCEMYARSAHRFLSAGLDYGARVDFRSRKLVGIGHSLGGVSMAQLQEIEPVVPFSTVILVEPLLCSLGLEPLRGLRSFLIKGAYQRRDVWPSRERAMEVMKLRQRSASWHPRVLELYVKYALRPHPGSYHPESPYNGVSLACTRDTEAGMYRDVDGPTKPIPGLQRTCSRIPVHIIFGNINDYMPRFVQDALIDPSSGRLFASITRIEGVGHLVPQEAPEELGRAVVASLAANSATSARSKL